VAKKPANEGAETRTPPMPPFSPQELCREMRAEGAGWMKAEASALPMVHEKTSHPRRDKHETGWLKEGRFLRGKGATGPRFLFFSSSLLFHSF